MKNSALHVMPLDITHWQHKDEVEHEDGDDQQGADAVGDGVAVRHEACGEEIPEMNGEGFATCHDVGIVEEP